MLAYLVLLQRGAKKKEKRKRKESWTESIGTATVSVLHHDTERIAESRGGKLCLTMISCVFLIRNIAVVLNFITIVTSHSGATP